MALDCRVALSLADDEPIPCHRAVARQIRTVRPPLSRGQALSLSKPVLSTCKAVEGPFFLLTPQEERRCFDRLGTNDRKSDADLMHDSLRSVGIQSLSPRYCIKPCSPALRLPAGRALRINFRHRRKAGVHLRPVPSRNHRRWVPAFAGTHDKGQSQDEPPHALKWCPSEAWLPSLIIFG